MTSRTDITVLTLSYSFDFGTRPLDILIHNNRNSSVVVELNILFRSVQNHHAIRTSEIWKQTLF